jgi:hypothetical protein
MIPRGVPEMFASGGGQMLGIPQQAGFGLLRLPIQLPLHPAQERFTIRRYAQNIFGMRCSR